MRASSAVSMPMMTKVVFSMSDIGCSSDPAVEGLHGAVLAGAASSVTVLGVVVDPLDRLHPLDHLVPVVGLYAQPGRRTEVDLQRRTVALVGQDRVLLLDHLDVQDGVERFAWSVVEHLLGEPVGGDHHVVGALGPGTERVLQ